MMSVGAFIAIAFVSPDLFDEIRDDIRETAEGSFSTVQEKVTDLSY
tara:strand:+ start:350 stop:487 length:138 start_codon:yes stop_codon:yes gene_type:complete